MLPVGIRAEWERAVGGSWISQGWGGGGGKGKGGGGDGRGHMMGREAHFWAVAKDWGM